MLQRKFIEDHFGKRKTTPKIYDNMTRIKQTKTESYYKDDPTKPYYGQLVGDPLVHIGALIFVQGILPRLEGHYYPKKSETTAPFVPNDYP